jgi:hypothetical protein
MKYVSLPVVGALGLVFIMATMAAAPQVVMADVGKQDSQQGSLVVDAKPGESAQPPASSGDVQERGLPQGVGPGLGGGELAPPIPMAFGCTVKTGQCKCYDTKDCAWMKSLIGGACTVPSGCTKNCTCTMVGR